MRFLAPSRYLLLLAVAFGVGLAATVAMAHIVAPSALTTAAPRHDTAVGLDRPGGANPSMKSGLPTIEC
jgi:hypothetical protein